MAYNERLTKADLDRMWKENQDFLTTFPDSWEGVTQQILLENEYDRKGWTVPKAS